MDDARMPLTARKWNDGMGIGLLLASAFMLCIVLGFVGFKALAATAAVLAIVNVLALRRDLFVVSCLIGISFLIDWYQLVGLPLALPVGAVVVAFAFVVLRFLSQSAEQPWVTPPYLWLWGGFVLVGAVQVIHGIVLSESVTYFTTVILGALLFCLIGMLVARDEARIRQLLIILTVFAVFIAIHSIIEARLGIFLFATSRLNDYLSTVNNFELAGSNAQRAASFLGNPDWNGAFLGMMLFVPLGLLFANTTRRARILYGVAVALILISLLFTYSTASFAAVAVSALVFAGLLTHGSFGGLRRLSLWQLIGGAGVLVIVGVIFRHPLGLLVQHATASNEYSLRLGAWLTALHVIAANPLTGIGLGLNNYLQRAEPYRVPLQYRPLAHPHNAYLELGAFGGLPLLLLFLALLITLLVIAIRAARLAEGATRALLCGGVAAVLSLSLNSLTINGWTLAPLALVGWLLLGALASPLLLKRLKAAQRQQREEIRQTPQ